MAEHKITHGNNLETSLELLAIRLSLNHLEKVTDLPEKKVITTKCLSSADSFFVLFFVLQMCISNHRYQTFTCNSKEVLSQLDQSLACTNSFPFLPIIGYKICVHCVLCEVNWLPLRCVVTLQLFVEYLYVIVNEVR